ncbi:MAG: hypothetical protein CM15mV106_050 [uncultured marine virus]|nr:MAG: hypothetical protein CM15mV106_050 [uncultured marine virus]
MDEIYEQDPLVMEQSVEDWVMVKCENWRDYYESNYEVALKNTIGFGVAFGILLIASVGVSVAVLSLLLYSKLLNPMLPN